MIKLLINKEDVGSMEEMSFGGLPVKGVGEVFEWPKCKCCDGYMRFLGKLKTDIGFEQIFMCENDPGLCEEWDAHAGGNQVVITTATEIEAVSPPEGSEIVRDVHHGVEVVEYDSKDYDEGRSDWAEANNVSPRQVLGQIYGRPSWIQGDETPACDGCGKPMRFVAQLEQGPDWKTEMNFGGGGCAYSFDCACNSSGKFLWQC